MAKSAASTVVPISRIPSARTIMRRGVNRSASTPPTITNPAKHTIHAPRAKLTDEAPCPVSSSPAASATGTMPSPKRATVRARKNSLKLRFQRVGPRLPVPGARSAARWMGSGMASAVRSFCVTKATCIK